MRCALLLRPFQLRSDIVGNIDLAGTYASSYLFQFDGRIITVLALSVGRCAHAASRLS